MKKSKNTSSPQEQLLQFQDLINQTPHPLAIFSHNLLQIHFLNQAFKTIFEPKEGYDEMVHLKNCSLEDGRHLISFIETEFLPNEKFKTSGQKLSCYVRYDQSYFETTIFSIIWNKQLSIAISFYDITKLFLASRAQNTEKEGLLKVISHTLKHPLNGILNAMEKVKKSIQDLQQIKTLSLCETNTHRLLLFLNTVEDVLMIKEKKLTLEIRKVNIYEILQETMTLFQNVCEMKGLSLELKISPNVPKYFLTDSQRLMQILINIVENAVKFTFKGRITISVIESKEVGNNVEFSVEDTGIGIRDKDKEILTQLLSKHNLLNASNNSGPQVQPLGIGLGLALANHLAKLLNDSKEGGLKVRSTYGQGSLFSFLLQANLAKNVMSQENIEDLGSEYTLADEVPQDDLGNLEQAIPYATFIPNNTQFFKRTKY